MFVIVTVASHPAPTLEDERRGEGRMVVVINNESRVGGQGLDENLLEQISLCEQWRMRVHSP